MPVVFSEMLERYRVFPLRRRGASPEQATQTETPSIDASKEAQAIEQVQEAIDEHIQEYGHPAHNDEEHSLYLAFTLISHGVPELREIVSDLRLEDRLSIHITDDLNEVAHDHGIPEFSGSALTIPGKIIEFDGEKRRTYNLFLRRAALQNFGETVIVLLKQLLSIERVERQKVLPDYLDEIHAILRRSLALGELISCLLREDAALSPTKDSHTLLEVARQIDGVLRRDRLELAFNEEDGLFSVERPEPEPAVLQNTQ